MSLTTGTAASPRTFNLRARARTLGFWVVLLLVSAVVSTLLLWPAGGSRLPLDPANPKPNGMKALAEVLRHEGVSIQVVHSFGQLDNLKRPKEPTTLVITGDLFNPVSDLEGLISRYAHVVIIGDPFDQFQEYLTTETVPSTPPLTFEADCPADIVGQARTLQSDAARGFTSKGSAQLCFTRGRIGAMVHFTLASGTVVDVIADDQLMTNALITRADAAALALTLMGRHAKLVWLNIDPSLIFENDDGNQSTDALSLVPPWFDAMAALLTWTAVVAMIWRGRRLGRLVVEPLPVVVKAVETTLGRGRIYHKTHAFQRSLEVLQQATVRRLAKRLALPSTADAAQISDAAATAANRDPSEVWQILTAPAMSEDDLVSRAQSLATLEQEVHLR